MTRTALNLINVSKRFDGETSAVSDLDLEVRDGEFLVLLGPSGCGKTTTLRMIAGFEEPDQGSVYIGEKLVAADGHFLPPEKRHIGMVFQDYALFPHLRVRENVAFGLSLKNGEKKERVAELLELVGLQDKGDRHPHDLSGGEQQRVALARTLAPDPKLILLDEPFSNLDADLRRQMRSEVKEILKRLGRTVILVTHDQDEAFELGDRVVILNNGKLEQIGTPEEIYYHPATKFVAEFVGRADFVEGCWCDLGIETELGFINQQQIKRQEDCGSVCEVLVRPDMVEIELDEEGTAVVIEQRFSGLKKLYCLELPSGRRIHSLQPSDAHFESGSRVRVEVDESQCVCFSKDS